MAPAPPTPDEFAAMLARAGIALPPREAEELRLAFPRFQAMLERLRDPAPALAEEPAFSFRVPR